jgi:Carbohydrate family 9 binding domain-like
MKIHPLKPLTFLLLSLAALAGCNRGGKSSPGERKPRPPPAALVLEVPHITGPIKLDGEATEEDWHHSGRSLAFVDTEGAEARPYSEARFLWDEENLYIVLYAADDNILSKVKEHDGPVWLDDSFSLRLTPSSMAPGEAYLIDVSAGAVTTDAKLGADGKRDLSWESGLKVAVDTDGTINNPKDEDEEWVVEGALPLRSLGLKGVAGERLAIEITRCDIPRAGGPKRCGGYGAARSPRVLVLAPKK